MIKNAAMRNFLFLTGALIFSSVCVFSCTSSKRNITPREPSQTYTVERCGLKSAVLQKEVPYIIYLPKGYGDGTEYPVWYGLHSYGANETMWSGSGIVERADELTSSGIIKPMIMVFPFVQDANALEIKEDLLDGKIDERKNDVFITTELIPYIDEHYFTQRKKESRFIGGFSMGGMLSLRIGFHHPDLFSKIGGYSPAVPSQDYSASQLEKWLYPNEQTDTVKDVKKYAAKKGYSAIEVYLDTGNTNDPFNKGVTSLYEALLKRGMKVSFRVYDGGHSLQTKYFTDYLTFYAGK